MQYLLISNCRDDWKGFFPRSNVLWLNYLASKAHESYVVKSRFPEIEMGPYVERILQNQSAKEVFLNIFSPEAVEMIKKKTAEKSISHTAL